MIDRKDTDGASVAATDRREERHVLATEMGEGGFSQRTLIKEEYVQFRRIEVRPRPDGGVAILSFSSGHMPNSVLVLASAEAVHVARLLLKAASGS